MGDRWPRALLRAALREAGYDAIGAASVRVAKKYRPVEPGRGRVAAIVADQGVLGGDPDELVALRRAHADAPAILLARATSRPPSGAWARVLRRPFALSAIVDAVESVAPLPRGAVKPIADRA